MKKVTVKEFCWYAACGIIIVFGLICMIFGIVGYHMGGSASMNFITNFEKKLPFGLRYWGIIFMAAGVLVGIIVLLVNAKKADREVEKKIRREQRLAAQSSQTIEVKQAVEVIEEPKPEPAAEEPKAE